MDPADPAQAASVPLPSSPPPSDEPMQNMLTQLSVWDPADENRARSMDGERPTLGEQEQHPGEPSSQPDTEPTSISQAEAPTSLILGTVEPSAESAEQSPDARPPNPLDRIDTADDSTPPPTPPAKPTQSNPTSPRKPLPLPSVPTSPRGTNGHGIPSPSSGSRPATPNGRMPSRQSTDTLHKRSLTLSKGHTVSVVLISSALNIIAASKEAKRSAPLRESVQYALEMVNSGQGGDRPRDIFEPLRLACETRNEKLMIASLDCISKLISYSFFAEPPHAHMSPPPSPALNAQNTGSHTNIPPPSLVDLVVHTITSCHAENTPETVSLQIVKALLALVLSPTVLVHQSSLLKAVRTVYNVFLLSVDPVNQMVAQGGLTQMVNHVFARCRIGSTHLPQSDSTTSLSLRDGDSGRSSKRSLVSSSLVSSPRNSLPLPPQSPSVHESEETGTTLVRESSETASSTVSVAQSEATEESVREDARNGQQNGHANGSHYEG